MPANATSPARPAVSIIVPARNEEANLATCLESLISQTGVTFEIIVVDDHSTDRTREIAKVFSDRGVSVIDAPMLPIGWTGKNNALIAGARTAQGEWLLFTDADTVHLPSSLKHASTEAIEHKADMLSYSPEQIAITFWEMAILPVVFAELARQYPPNKVSDPSSLIAAANGQYILIKREAYNAIGGHTAVANAILEDVALARAVKRSGRRIFFRYAADAARTRMYRNFAQLREGWTKNLALLFSSPAKLAFKMLAFWVVPVVALALTCTHGGVHGWSNVIFILGFLFLAVRLRRANFTWDREVLAAIFGYPMFVYLLLRSKKAHCAGRISWKSRTYNNQATQDSNAHSPKGPTQQQPSTRRSQTDNWELTTDN